MCRLDTFNNCAKIIAFLVCILFFKGSLTVAQLQNVFVVYDTSKLFCTELKPYYAFYIDPTGKQTIEEIARSTFDTSIFSLGSVSKHYKNKSSRCCIRVNIKNIIDSNLRLILCAWRTDGESVYILKNGKYIHLGDKDVFFTTSPKMARGIFQFSIDRNADITLYILISNQYNKLYHINFFKNLEYIRYPDKSGTYLLNTQSQESAGYLLDTQDQIDGHIERSLWADKYSPFTQHGFLSIIFLMFILTLIQYTINKRKEFLWYSIFSFSIFCLFLHRGTQTMYFDFPFRYFPQFLAKATYSIWFIMHFTYFRFMQHFISFRTVSTWYYKASKYAQCIMALCLVLEFILLFLIDIPELHSALFTFFRTGVLLISLCFVYFVFHMRRSELYFLASGLLALSITGILAFISEKLIFLQFIYPLTYIRIGIILEL